MEETLNLLEGEEITFKRTTSLQTFFAMKGGTLYITNKRICFQKKLLGLGKVKSEIILKLSDVLVSKKAIDIWLFNMLPLPTAMQIRMKDGRKLKFTGGGYAKMIDWINNNKN